MIKTLFQKVEMELEKRFPTLAPKVKVRLFDSAGNVTREGGDAGDDISDDTICLDIRPLSSQQDAETREAYRVGA